MKIPTTGTNPGENAVEAAEPVGNASGGSGNSGNNPEIHQPATNGSSNEPDFSEYLWMEHEDDFDQQVLNELHEEETLNYYCDLYEEAQENDHMHSNHHFIAPNPPPMPTIEIRTGADALSAQFDRVLNFSSRLNPEAPEFVPRLPTSSSQSSDETSNKKNPSDDSNDKPQPSPSKPSD